MVYCFISEAISQSKESKDTPDEQKSICTETSTPAPDHLPNSSRSSSSNSMGSPPTQTTDSDDVGLTPEQEHPPERRFSQTLIEEISSQLPAPTPVHLPPQEASTSAGQPSATLSHHPAQGSSISAGEPSATHSPRPASPPLSLPRALREIAALSSLPSYALPLLEMGFSRRHVIQAMMATGTRETADARRINMLVTWLLEHPVSDDGVSQLTSTTLLHLPVDTNFIFECST